MTSEEGSKEEENKKVSSEGEEIGDVGRMVCDLSSQPDRSVEDSLQKDETRLESAKELGEINAIEKQKAKEIEKLEKTKRDTELVHQKVSKEMVKNIATENNGPVAEILMSGKNLTNKNKKDEKADLERK